MNNKITIKEKIFRIIRFLIDKQFIIFIILAILTIFATQLAKKGNLIMLVIIAFFLLLFAIFITTALLIASLSLILEQTKTPQGLFLKYLLSILSFVLFFIVMYVISSVFQWGNLTYGQCHDTFDKSIPDNESVISFQGLIYFTSITFFTVGYGDICPAGFSRIIAIANAFAGHVFTTIILIIAITLYIDYRRRYRKREKVS